MKLADEVTQQSAQTTAILSSGYDAVYSAIETSPTLRRLWHEYAEGPDFPKEFGHRCVDWRGLSLDLCIVCLP